MSSTDFFAGPGAPDLRRAPGLTDPNILAQTGDFGTDRMLEIIAQEKPVRPAAVLIPVVEA